ncbi:hypothetical protein ABZX34_24825 [Streptomyces sp. NPDC004362]|uniref:hypothetical protein n=1 Tax=Streptomyces sp. NPDC004362 TaxID=3154456 RepID=UPI0033B082FB
MLSFNLENSMRIRRYPGALVTAVAALVAASATPAFSAATPHSSALAAQPLAASAAGQPSHTVTLVTGDRVTVTPGPFGKPAYTVEPHDAKAKSGFHSYDDLKGNHFVIPDTAEPYLGRILDPQLFNVTQLLKDGYGDSADVRTPIRLTFPAGSTPTAPDGVTLTSVRATSVDGYITPASGARFADALQAQIAADVKNNWHKGTFLGGVSAVAFAGPVDAPQVTPHYPMRTLQVHVIDKDGNPAPFATFTIINVDDQLRGTTPFAFAVDGEARVSLPEGNYSAAMTFYDRGSDGLVTAQRLVSVADFKVGPADGTTPSITLDERTATTQVTVSTPKPSEYKSANVAWVRRDVVHPDVAGGFSDQTENAPYYVSAGQKTQVGALGLAVGYHAVAPGPDSTYSYDLYYEHHDGIPADLHYRLSKDQLTAVDNRYHRDVPGDDVVMTQIASPYIPVTTPVGHDVVKAPGHHTDYYTKDPNTLISVQIGRNIPGYGAEGQAYRGDWKPLPTKDSRADWMRGTHVPTFNADYDNAHCYGCRSGDSMVFAPLVESYPDDDDGIYFPWSIKPHLSLDVDGTLIYAGDSTGVLVSGMPDEAHSIRAVYDRTMTTPNELHGTQVHTEWTFTSAKHEVSGIPSGHYCPTGNSDPCAALPVLTTSYRIVGADLSGQAKSGHTALDLTVAHQRYADQTPIRTVKAEVSFDAGATWHQAKVKATRAGHYNAEWFTPQSAIGTMPTLRVTATDTAGSSITQTVQNAYTVTARH